MSAPGGAALRFPAKRDAWLVALLWAAAAGAALAALFALRLPAPAATRWLLALACVAPLPFVFWTIRATYYEVDDRVLFVRSGPFRLRVPLAAIEEVRPASALSLEPGWSFATSLDRLLVRRSDSPLRVAISPADPQLLLVALAARCPQLALAGDRLVRRR